MGLVDKATSAVVGMVDKRIFNEKHHGYCTSTGAGFCPLDSILLVRAT